MVLTPRLFALDKVVTIDEWLWLRRSGNFLKAVSDADWAHTYQRWHPGVTTMWAGAVGVQLEFPGYRAQAPGQFEWDYYAFDDFLKANDKTQLQLLIRGRQVLVFGLALLLGICAWLIKRLAGWLAALLTIGLVALDPYYLGHSRLLHIEGVLSTCLLLSLLAIVVYTKEKRSGFLLLSAAAAALACLSKSTGIIMFAYAGLVLLLDWLGKQREAGFWRGLVQPMVIWLAAAALVFWALWPAMWVQPGASLNNVFGQAFGFVTRDPASAPLVEIEGDLWGYGAGGYALSLLWRSTPATWMGCILAGLLWLWGRKRHPQWKGWVFAGHGLGLALAFLVMMSLAAAGGKRAPHYILTVHLMLNIIAGLGWAAALDRMRKSGQRAVLAGLVAAGVLLWQAANAAAYYPYYFNYYDPLLGSPAEGMQAVGGGYGEGLELAAQLLAQRKKARINTALVYYAYGPFSYYYPGKTIDLPLGNRWGKIKINRLDKADYLVVYYAQQMRRSQESTLMQTLAQIEPWQSVWLKGIEYVRIYRVNDLPENLFISDP